MRTLAISGIMVLVSIAAAFAPPPAAEARRLAPPTRVLLALQALEERLRTIPTGQERSVQYGLVISNGRTVTASAGDIRVPGHEATDDERFPGLRFHTRPVGESGGQADEAAASMGDGTPSWVAYVESERGRLVAQEVLRRRLVWRADQPLQVIRVPTKAVLGPVWVLDDQAALLGVAVCVDSVDRRYGIVYPLSMMTSVSLVSPSTGKLPEIAVQQLLAGTSEMAFGRYAAAGAELFPAAAETDGSHPWFSDCLWDALSAYARVEGPKKALIALQRIRPMARDLAILDVIQAVLESLAGNGDRAVELLKRTISKRPVAHLARLELFRIERARNPKSMQVLSLVLPLPAFDCPHQICGPLGVELISYGRHEEAEPLLGRAVALPHCAPEELHAYGIVHWEKGDFLAARRYLSAAIGTPGAPIEWHEDLGHALVRVGASLVDEDARRATYSEAVRALTAAIEHGAPNEETYFSRASSLVALGHLEAAIPDMEECVRRVPLRVDGWEMLGELYKRTKREQDFNRVLVELEKLNRSAADRLRRKSGRKDPR